MLLSLDLLQILFVGNCTADYPECRTIWNTDLRQLYEKVITGRFSRDEWQSFCRFRFRYCQ